MLACLGSSPAELVDSAAADALVIGTCIDVVASAELIEAVRVLMLEVDASSSDDVIVTDGRKDAVTVGVCERSEVLSSCRRTADCGAAVTEFRQSKNAMHTISKLKDRMAKIWSRRGLVWGINGHRISIKNESGSRCDLKGKVNSKCDARFRKERRAEVKTVLDM